MGYSIQQMLDAYADLVQALKQAHPDFRMEHTGGGCFVLMADIGEEMHLAIGAADGPLHYPDEPRGPLALCLFHSDEYCDEWPEIFREATADPEHGQLIAIAKGAAEAAKTTAEILRAKAEEAADLLPEMDGPLEDLMAQRYAGMLAALKTAGVKASLDNTGGNCYLVIVNLADGSYLGIGSDDGPLCHPGVPTDYFHVLRYTEDDHADFHTTPDASAESITTMVAAIREAVEFAAENAK